jgi:hypothetical protein
MNAIISKEGNYRLPYPKLMIFNGDKHNIIVLMTSSDGEVYGTGTVVYSTDEGYKYGFFSNTWGMNVFEDFMGKLTLSN